MPIVDSSYFYSVVKHLQLQTFSNLNNTSMRLSERGPTIVQQYVSLEKQAHSLHIRTIQHSLLLVYIQQYLNIYAGGSTENTSRQQLPLGSIT